MGGGRASRENYCKRTSFSVGNAIGSCKMQGNLDNVVIIDLDSDGFDDVITMDIPESLQQKFSGYRGLRDGKRYPVSGIIIIDDDDGFENDYVDHQEFTVEENAGLDCDGNNARDKNSRATDFAQKSVHADVDDCKVIFERKHAFKLSKCNKDYSKACSSNSCYGLNSGSETQSDSSESSSSDCEVMEGPVNKLREQWVKSFQKRKLTTDYKGRYGLQEQASPCSSHSDTDPNASVENGAKKCIKEPAFTSSKNVKFPDVDSSDFAATEDGCVGGACSSWMENPCAESDEKVEQEAFSFWWKQELRENIGFQRKDGVQCREETCAEDFNFCFNESKSENAYGSRFPNERDSPLEHVGSSCYKEGQKPVKDFSSNTTISDGKKSKDPLDAPFGGISSTVQVEIIKEREKLKETDEFKRAAEEEWESRQQQIKIQAEEAQRLRKRKKAERLRILNMEKRQKQRVEEVRETQRKDEENLNTKDSLRAEVRKELYQLENTCVDMASLLRGLGIHVEGGFSPLSQEVHAAYKQALLKFHPDRASRFDVRQQVEAEEKFKLISRMKEEFLSTSCR